MITSYTRRKASLPDSSTRFRCGPMASDIELLEVFRLAVDAGAEVSAIQIGRTRDLTSPVDLMNANFDYLRGLKR